VISPDLPSKPPSRDEQDRMSEQIPQGWARRRNKIITFLGAWLLALVLTNPTGGLWSLP